jgi:hypothetical protein
MLFRYVCLSVHDHANDCIICDVVNMHAAQRRNDMKNRMNCPCLRV